MRFVAAYFVIGALLVFQSLFRGWKFWKPRYVEDWLAVFSAVFLWPLAVLSEMREVWKNRR